MRVTNLKTGHSTIVRITDRGPFVEGRIVDLSLAAAKQADVWQAGVAQVRLEVLRTPVPFNSGGRWAVQIGSFPTKDSARSLGRPPYPALQDRESVALRQPGGRLVGARPGPRKTTASGPRKWRTTRTRLKTKYFWSGWTKCVEVCGSDTLGPTLLPLSLTLTSDMQLPSSFLLNCSVLGANDQGSKAIGQECPTHTTQAYGFSAACL